MKAWMRALRRRSGCVSTHNEDLDTGVSSRYVLEFRIVSL